MGRMITSPVEGWGGTITLYDPITLPQQVALEDAGIEVRKYLLEKMEADGYKPSLEEDDFKKAVKKGFNFSVTKRNLIFWPAMRKCIQEWNIDAFVMPGDNDFPARPRQRSIDFLDWLLEEINKDTEEQEEVKNE